MSYGNVRTPKIMVNLFEWLVSHRGYSSDNTKTGNLDFLYDNSFNVDPNLTTTNFTYFAQDALADIDTSSLPFWTSPYSTLSFPSQNTEIKLMYNFYVKDGYDTLPLINSLFISGEDINGIDVEIKARISENSEKSLFSGTINEDGYSIIEFDRDYNVSGYHQIEVRLLRNSGINQLNSVILGSMYEFEHSPQFSIKMTNTFDGVLNTTNIGGHDSSTLLHLGTPRNPFNSKFVGGGANALAGAEGRKSWELNFNFLSDEKTLPKNFNDPRISNRFVENFHSMVLSKTIGNHIKFLFIPNSQETFSPPDVFLCKFDQSDFTFDEVAPSLYNMNLKIKESW
tara:strand:+ start:1311 stop:2330 length:1020 start_codon:yes stop_codon:yes gene_type:complete